MGESSRGSTSATPPDLISISFPISTYGGLENQRSCQTCRPVGACHAA